MQHLICPLKSAFLKVLLLLILQLHFYGRHWELVQWPKHFWFQLNTFLFLHYDYYSYNFFSVFLLCPHNDKRSVAFDKLNKLNDINTGNQAAKVKNEVPNGGTTQLDLCLLSSSWSEGHGFNIGAEVWSSPWGWKFGDYGIRGRIKRNENRNESLYRMLLITWLNLSG